MQKILEKIETATQGERVVLVLQASGQQISNTEDAKAALNIAGEAAIAMLADNTADLSGVILNLVMRVQAQM